MDPPTWMHDTNKYTITLPTALQKESKLSIDPNVGWYSFTRANQVT